MENRIAALQDMAAEMGRGGYAPSASPAPAAARRPGRASVPSTNPPPRKSRGPWG